MICKDCKQETSSTADDRCHDCYRIADAAWKAKMAIRQDTTQFDITRLLGLLITHHWMHECKIIPRWMPKFPREDTEPKCVVEFTYEGGETTYLRHSIGPLQGYFWDSYPDAMHTPELALLALVNSPPPPRIDYVIPTHGRWS
jgi:hypothetical protein